MVKIDGIKNALSKYYGREIVIHYIYDLGSYYVAVALPPKVKPEDVDDAYLKVDKKSLKVSGYSPFLDIEAYKKAIKNPVYVKDGK